MKINITKIKFSSPRIVNLLFLIAIFLTMCNVKYWNKPGRVICQDVISYYAYLPATFIYKDLTLSFINTDPSFFNDKFWPLKTEDDKYVIKMSMGLSLLYAPFFLIGHLAAGIGGYEQSGFSMPYKFALQMSILFYLAFALGILRKILQKIFNNEVVAVVLLCILFGTNLYNYSSFESTVSHSYSFCLFVIFFWQTEKWLDKQTLFRTLGLGLLGGLITLIRPSNIIILLFIPLMGISSFGDLKARFGLLFQNYKFVLIMVLAFVAVWIPQFLYWKIATGHYIYYSYQEQEQFFFNNPQIINGLFGFRKGWLVYTPLMTFALIGIFCLIKKNKKYFAPFLIFTCINIYIVLSWWCWWYGGSFGMRPFVDSYGIMAIPFAACIAWIFSKRKIFKIITYLIITGLVALNLFQTDQYYGGIRLHYDAMSYDAYWASFGRLEKPEGFEKLLDHPDYEAARNGEQKTFKSDDLFVVN